MNRKVNVGGTLSEAFSTYRAQATVLLPVAFWLFLFVAIVNGVTHRNLALLPIDIAVSLIAGMLYQGIVVGQVRDVKAGRSDFSVGGMMRSAAPVLLPLIGAGFLWGLAVGIGLVLLIVPGLILLTIWAVIAPVIVIEHTGVLGAFGRSRELVRGNGWPVFGVIIVAYAIAVVVGLLFKAIAAAIATGLLISIVFTAIASTATAPIGALVAAVLYFRLCAIEEESGTSAADPSLYVGVLPPRHLSRSHRIADPIKRPRLLDTASWFAIGGLVLAGLANLMRLRTAVALHEGAGPVNVAELSGLPGLHRSDAIWSGFVLFAYALAAAMFIPWFAMAYANLRRLGVQQLRWSNGWAVGAWFVPILGLVRPKQIANDIWRGSEPGIDVSSERWQCGPVAPVIHWWWALFLLGGFVVSIGSAIAQSGYRNLIQAVEFGLEREHGLAKMRTGSLIEILGCAGLVVAAVLGAMFVRRATQRLESIRRQAILAEPVHIAGQASMAASSAVAGIRQALPDAAPLQDLVRCPECAEFVLPVEACRYCGYRFTG